MWITDILNFTYCHRIFSNQLKSFECRFTENKMWICKFGFVTELVTDKFANIKHQIKTITSCVAYRMQQVSAAADRLVQCSVTAWCSLLSVALYTKLDAKCDKQMSHHWLNVDNIFHVHHCQVLPTIDQWPSLFIAHGSMASFSKSIVSNKVPEISSLISSKCSKGKVARSLVPPNQLSLCACFNPVLGCDRQIQFTVLQLMC